MRNVDGNDGFFASQAANHSGRMVLLRRFSAFHSPTSAPQKTHPTRRSQGFTLIELLAVVGIISILAAMSLPSISQAVTNMHLSSSANTLSAVVQSTRYSAISSGCPFELVITASNNSYQILQEQILTPVTLPPTPPYCDTSGYTPYYLSPLPVVFAKADIAIDANKTLVFNPSGVISVPGDTTNTPASFSILVSVASGTASKTVSITGVGHVTVH